MKRKPYCYEWPRPGVTVDITLFTVAGALNDLRLQVLLIQRDELPWQGQWCCRAALCANTKTCTPRRCGELEEETGIPEAVLEQVVAVGTPGRDMRGHVITIVYVGLIAGDRHELKVRGDARAARWFNVQELPALAFDHAELLQRGRQHLQRRLGEEPVCFELLPETFTLSELQALTETILGHPLDKRNFRRKVQDLGLVIPTENVRQQGAHWPAQLFRLAPEQAKRYGGRGRMLPF